MLGVGWGCSTWWRRLYEEHVDIADSNCGSVSRRSAKPHDHGLRTFRRKPSLPQAHIRSLRMRFPQRQDQSRHFRRATIPSSSKTRSWESLAHRRFTESAWLWVCFTLFPSQLWASNHPIHSPFYCTHINNATFCLSWGNTQFSNARPSSSRTAATSSSRHPPQLLPTREALSGSSRHLEGLLVVAQHAGRHKYLQDLVEAIKFSTRCLFMLEFEVPYIYTYKQDYITYFNPEDMYRSPTTQFLIPSPSYIIFPCSQLNPLRSSLCTFLSDEYKASPKI